jgi:thiamine biosynthesis lipoprotein
MGTTNRVTLYGTDNEQYLDDAIALVNHYEDVLTVERTTSEMMSINQASGLQAVQVSPATYQLVKRAVLVSQEHFGFNAAIGPLVKLWHIGFKDAQVPADTDIKQRLTLINPDEIVLNDDDLSVFLPKVGMELDLGAIAKGWIADRVQDLWRSQGQLAGIINFGGNNVLMNPAPHKTDGRWRIGVRDPLVRHGETIGIVTTNAGSVVTSGVAERHLVANGKSYHHIIDPETGYPHDNELASVTVLSKESIDGEIETTRLFFNDGPLTTDYPFGAIFIYRDRSIELVNIDPKDFKLTNTTFHIKET